MQVSIPDVWLNPEMESEHGHRRSKAAEKLSHAVAHDLVKLMERHSARDEMFRKRKPKMYRGMTLRRYRQAMDSYRIQNSFSRRHPFLFVAMIGTIFFVVKWLLQWWGLI